MSKISATRDGSTLQLVLNAPRGNILDGDMIAELRSALDANDDAALKAIVFSGAGPSFSFGASVEEHRAERAAAMLRAFHGLFGKLAAMSVPTFAVVRGRCLGGGMELATWCSFVFAEPNAQFAQPEIHLGLFPPLASVLLAWRFGGARALDLCVSGRTIGAIEAESIGLVHQLAEDPHSACTAFISEHIATSSASSLRFAERAARAELYELLERRLPRLEREYLEELMVTPDANEGIAAFLEKRRPAWT